MISVVVVTVADSEAQTNPTHMHTYDGGASWGNYRKWRGG